MPSIEPATQERGFRTALWGFDKNDVLAYMNALANETQQQEAAYQEQISQLQEQIDKYKKEQANARVCVEKLQGDLVQALGKADEADKRAVAAEKKAGDIKGEITVLNSQLTAADEKTESYAGRYQEARQSYSEAQLRIRDMQKEIERLKAAAADGTVVPTAVPAPVEVPAPTPVVQPMPETRVVTGDSITEEARVEARKILADARIMAENAEQRLKAEERQQKDRMADNARDLAAGVLLLRDRLKRVDEQLSTASLDLENATAAIYDALDSTTAQITQLGGEMRTFGEDKPQAVMPAENTDSQPRPVSSQAESPVHTLRPKVSAQPVVRRAKAQPQPPEQPGRLRRASHNRRPISQELYDAVKRMDDSK